MVLLAFTKTVGELVKLVESWDGRGPQTAIGAGGHPRRTRGTS